MEHEQSPDEPMTQPEMDADGIVPAEDDVATSGDPGDDSDAPVVLEPEPGAMAAEIRADNVNLTQGGAQMIEAQTVSIQQGGAARVHAEQLSVSQGGVGFARTEQLTVEANASAFAVMADEATINEGGNVFVLLTRSVSGDGKAVVDWRALLALLVGLALVLRVLRR